MPEGPAAGFRRRVKQTPPFLADAAASDLCEHRPPFGLLDKPSRMSAIAALAASYGLEPGVATGAGGRLADGRAAIPKGREAASANESRSLCAAVATALLAASGRPRRASLGSCAVVGSAGGLFGSSSGEEIDSHESVIRFNNAPAGGRFGDHVGRRTSLFVAPHCRESGTRPAGSGTSKADRRVLLGVPLPVALADVACIAGRRQLDCSAVLLQPVARLVPCRRAGAARGRARAPAEPAPCAALVEVPA